MAVIKPIAHIISPSLTSMELFQIPLQMRFSEQAVRNNAKIDQTEWFLLTTKNRDFIFGIEASVECCCAQKINCDPIRKNEPALLLYNGPAVFS